MADQRIDVNINQMEILGPVVAAQLTTALYSNAVLRQLQGEKPENLFSEEAIKEVKDTWLAIWNHLDLASKNMRK